VKILKLRDKTRLGINSTIQIMLAFYTLYLMRTNPCVVGSYMSISVLQSSNFSLRIEELKECCIVFYNIVSSLHQLDLI